MTEKEIIQIPNLSAKELVTKAKKEIDTTFLARELETQDFMTDEAGKRYEVTTHRFNRRVINSEVCDHFKELGFVGNTAAFLAWVIKRKPYGVHAVILDVDRLLTDRASGMLLTPFFQRGDGDVGRRLDLCVYWALVHWDSDTVFVAFREVPAP